MARQKISALRSPYYSNLVGSVSFTIGAEATNAITVTVQMKQTNLDNLTVRGALKWYLSGNVAGDGLVATAPSGGVAAGAAGTVIEEIADKAGLVVSDATGVANFVLTDTGTPTFYLVICLPDGSIQVSPAITFA